MKYNKNLSFHLARHTFSTTIALANGMPIETLSKILGHNSIKTTQIYARITDTKVSQDMNSLADKLKATESNQPINDKSQNLQIDLQFECLTLVEKMKLFNLPKTLTIEPEREERISTLWHGLSEEKKHLMWTNAFEKAIL